MTGFLIAVLPLLLLLGLLLCGRYPGHLAAMRLGERIFSRRRARLALARETVPPSPASHAVRGGLLIAFGLARRPPPLVA